jgi:hypothetical protein
MVNVAKTCFFLFLLRYQLLDDVISFYFANDDDSKSNPFLSASAADHDT